MSTHSMRYGKINNTQRITQIVNDIRYTVVYQHLVHDDVQLASVHNMHAYVICPRHRHTHTHPPTLTDFLCTYLFMLLHHKQDATCNMRWGHETTKHRVLVHRLLWKILFEPCQLKSAWIVQIFTQEITFQMLLLISPRARTQQEQQNKPATAIWWHVHHSWQSRSFPESS